MADPTSGTHFKRLQHFKTEYAPHNFTQYESTRTGMRSVVIDREGPKVYGFFALATEIFDDSGAPHTLEHLVFMGSKSYKFKGFLDQLATRAYSFTNAWTATDHTAYTLETAGWQGFRQILPIYLEHILLPTLTDAGCYTEVHHINGEGNDAGVVYSEMQGTQNEQSELMDLEARRIMYPEGIGYRYETGGMMEQLRVLTADRIREFHKEMYQPKNLCVVVMGEVDHTELLSTLETFESSIVDEVPSASDPWKRPWMDSRQPPAIPKSVTQVVKFPEEDESMGEVLVGYLGPDVNDALQSLALDVVIRYLSGSSVSILENVLVEKEQLASSVSIYTDERPDTTIWVTLSSVETDRLAEVDKRFLSLMKEVVEKPLDLKYMLDCVQRTERQFKFHVEKSGQMLPHIVISDHLFGNRNGSNLREVETLKDFATLEKWSEGQWKEFITKWLVNVEHVSILGTPSAAMSKELKDKEEARLAKRREDLGSDGLKKLEEQLEDAKRQNDVKIPDSLLTQFPIPGVDSIHFVNTTTARSGEAKKMGKLDNEVQTRIDEDKSTSPLFIHFEHIPSNFVQISLILSTDRVPVAMRPLLTVYYENFFNTPIKRGDATVPFEDVVMELERDTVAYDIRDGSAAAVPENIRINFICEPNKYETVIEWLIRLSVDPVFDPVRINAAVTKLLADVPEEKRSGHQMLQSVVTAISYTDRSISRASDTLVKALYLKRLKRLLKNDPNDAVKRLEQVRDFLFQSGNMRLLVIGDILTLPNPSSAWTRFYSAFTRPDTPFELLPLDKQRDRISPQCAHPGNLTHVVPMPTVDSSFGLHQARGPQSWSDPQVPALMVAMAYLDAVEGPMWTTVRGTGLAYGTSFGRSIDAGVVKFRVYRSPNAFKAWEAGRKVVKDLAEGVVPFEDLRIEGAISSIVVGFADEEPTMATAAYASFVNQVVKGLPKSWNMDMLKKVRAVTVEEIKKAMREFLLPVFEPSTSNNVVTCAPVLEKDIVEGFSKEGFEVDVQPLSHFQYDYGFEVPGGDDSEDDEDDDGEASDAESEHSDKEHAQGKGAHDEL